MEFTVIIINIKKTCTFLNTFNLIHEYLNHIFLLNLGNILCQEIF